MQYSKSTEKNPAIKIALKIILKSSMTASLKIKLTSLQINYRLILWSKNVMAEHTTSVHV